jgi:L-ascorbate metabolism protein UlaG (beta-lactamase superfamily)
VTGGRITYVGHATVLIEVDGALVLTDPVLRARVAHLRRIAPPVGELPPKLDAILVSHGHWDHLDLPSFGRFDRSTRVIVPRGLGRLLRRRGFADTVEVDVGDRVEAGGLEVTATFAEHDGRRGPLGARAPALGFVVTGSKRVYFAGDTDLFDGMAELAAGLDVGLIPVSGWGPGLGPGHLDPERAAQAAAMLRPRLAVPIHWGTLQAIVGDPPPTAPADEFRDLVAELAPGVDVRVLAPGEALGF